MNDAQPLRFPSSYRGVSRVRPVKKPPQLVKLLVHESVDSSRSSGYRLILPECGERNRRHPLQRGGRKAWAKALKTAGLPYFPIYHLRHTFASRLTAAGVSPLTIAHMLGHSSTQIVPRYAQVMDQNRLDAMKKLEEWKKEAVTSHEAAESPSDKTIVGIPQ
jgi:integrase